MNTCWCGNTKLGNYSEHYFKCDKCHTLITKCSLDNQIYDVTDEDTDFYGKNYWEVSMVKAAGKNTLSEVVDMYLAERVNYWMMYILKYIKFGSDVAEVGCGLGQLQYVLNRAGYRQLAYELSEDICNYMERELKINVHCGVFEEKAGAYDAVLAFDLFEHLAEPVDFIKKCANSLKNNGVLGLQLPCYDPDLDYDEMVKKKGRFIGHLREEQHIFLYSRQSIEKILREVGFVDIVFEPAFFGDDYDMFLFASKGTLQVNTDEEIDKYLNSIENGRLVKAMLKQFEDLTSANDNALKHLEQIDKLTELLKESETDRDARLEQVNKLTEMLKENEADRGARQEQINKLTEMLKESEADRGARQEQINKLTEMLKESEADRAARFEQINILTEMLKERKAGRK